MIQELLGGGATLNGGERKPSISSVFECSPSPSPSSSTTTTTTTTTAPAANSTAPPESQNLRCPRCDSSNTKFCYYNNYNLTQPRHFCKTCRRYWTKGGALRNVPIGGGCRKNKSTVSLTPSVGSGKSGGGGGRLMKTVMSCEMGKLGIANGFDYQEIPSSNPVMWASPAQNSHLLALLRATQNPNPNPNPIPNLFGSSHMTSGSDSTMATEALSSFWRSNQNQAQQQQQNQPHHHQQQQQQPQQIGFVIGEVQNNGFHEIYQRLRSTANYYPDHHLPAALLSNVNVASTASTSSSSTILESAPVGAGDHLGYWPNPTLTWSDLPTTNGASYP